MNVQEAVKAVGVVVREMERCYGLSLIDAADMVQRENNQRRAGDPDFMNTGVYFELELTPSVCRLFRLAYDRLKEISP